jgi:DNA-directed RNA polymerase specialized sigma24 family protein
MKEWVLTEDAFIKLLEQLDKNRERAGEQYERIRLKLVKFFEWRGCFPGEEYADKAMDRVARKIYEGEEIRSSDPYTYFHGVARFILMEKWREPENALEGLDALPPSAEPAENPLAKQEEADEQERLERRMECMSHCLQVLPPESRELMLHYHQGEKSEKIKNRKALSERLKIPLNALRIRTHRIRAGLEACVEKRLKNLFSR